MVLDAPSQSGHAARPAERARLRARLLPLQGCSTEYERTGFQGGLQWQRCATGAQYLAELQLFAGRTIEVPAMFVAGRGDWGVYQKPGDFQKMQATACTKMLGCHLVDGVGHWVQQEQPDTVNRLLVEFLRTQARA